MRLVSFRYSEPIMMLSASPKRHACARSFVVRIEKKKIPDALVQGARDAGLSRPGTFDRCYTPYLTIARFLIY